MNVSRSKDATRGSLNGIEAAGQECGGPGGSRDHSEPCIAACPGWATEPVPSDGGFHVAWKRAMASNLVASLLLVVIM